MSLLVHREVLAQAQRASIVLGIDAASIALIEQRTMNKNKEQEQRARTKGNKSQPRRDATDLKDALELI